MYRGYEIASVASFRVTRNSNLYLEEEESRNLLESVRTELHRRRKGDAVRLEIEADAHPEIAERLQQTFELENWQIFSTQGPVNLSRLFNFYELTERPDLKFKPFVARELRLPSTSNNIFTELRKRDILLHHPFDSFETVVDFIESAAKDPAVISFKQTIYRTSDQRFGQIHHIVEIRKRHLRLDHPELGQVTARLRLLGAERRAEAIHAAERHRIRFVVQLPALRQVRRLFVEILRRKQSRRPFAGRRRKDRQSFP